MSTRLPLDAGRKGQVYHGADGRLLPAHDEEVKSNRELNISSDEKDSESERRQSSKSGFTSYTEDTQATSVRSRRSIEHSHLQLQQNSTEVSRVVLKVLGIPLALVSVGRGYSCPR